MKLFKLITILFIFIVLSLLLPSVSFAAVYTATTTAGYTSTFDGWVERSGVCDTTANYRAGAGTASSTIVAAPQFVYADSRTCAAGSIKNYNKTIFKFNLNAIPSNATITGVKFSPYIQKGGDNNSQRIVITSIATANSTSVSTADYAIGSQGTTFYASSTIASTPASFAYFDFNFNSAGITYVQNTFQTASTTLTARLSWDFDNVTLGTGNVEDNVASYQSDDGAYAAAKLEVTYTTPLVRKIRGVGISR